MAIGIIRNIGGGGNIPVIPDGKTATPINDIPTWLKCAGIPTTSYTTLTEVLADTYILSTVINTNNAIDYLIRSTAFTSGICGDSTAMAYIGANNYAANTLLGNSTWRDAICNSTYLESVLNVKVPVMTSNTTPSGEVSASSSANANRAPYKAFDGTTKDDENNSSRWESASQGSDTNFPYIQYNFGKNVRIYKAIVDNHSRYNTSSTAWRNLDFKIQGLLTTQSTPEDITDIVTAYVKADNYTKAVNLSGNEYPIIRIQATNNNVYYNGYYVGIYMIQFYGRQDV